MEVISRDAWLEKAKTLFGTDPLKWKFKCPSCGQIQSGQDFMDAGMEKQKAMQLVYQECIGRHTKDRGCDWAVYGLLSIHEVEVEYEKIRTPIFNFAE